jgi:hypothetical protein
MDVELSAQLEEKLNETSNKQSSLDALNVNQGGALLSLIDMYR